MKEYRLVMTRPLTLIHCQNWEYAERVLLPKKFNNLLYFDPLFLFGAGFVKVFYNYSDPSQNPYPLLKFIVKNPGLFDEELSRYYENCRLIKKLLDDNSTDPKKFFDLINEVFPILTVVVAFGDDSEFIPDGMIQKFIDARVESDILHPATYRLSELIAKSSNSPFSDWILPTEYFDNAVPPEEELKKRSQGCIYHLGEVSLNIERYLSDNQINLVDPETDTNVREIRGNIANPGVATGKVAIVLSNEDTKKVNDGDILVSPMTVPEFLPAMRKAAAFVTDEGGITCHAAIVAREIGKPCIIGTKIATKVLKDGDLVEVDADHGIVKILRQ